MKTINEKTEEIFKEIGEFGPYQLLIFLLVGVISFVPAIVGYSYSFYGATPNFRCKIPILENDTYEIQNRYHHELIEKYIPPSKDKSFKDKYDKCNLRIYLNDDLLTKYNLSQSLNIDSVSNFTLVKCKDWVYSKSYFDETLVTKWNLVCDNSPRKSLFSTLYFIGTYGVFLSGLLSDRYGRKKTIYIFIVANAILNTIMSILINYELFEIDLQQILFGVVRLFCGIASNVYAAAVVMAIEICGPTKRVTAANSIYYMYIIGEFLVVFLAYFIRNFRILYVTYTILMSSFVIYFWIVPESPRWLMVKKRDYEAYKIFRRIALSNKKTVESLNDIELLDKKRNFIKRKDNHQNSVTPANDVNEKLNDSNEKTEKTFSTTQTIKIFFKSKKLIIQSTVILLNWLTNTLVYYGISFNTNDLAGDPYLNFSLSVIVELFAIIVTHYTLERFGRKIPYCINMGITGLALLFVLFIPSRFIVTVIALIGKFAISFTYNTIYIITAEMYPTVIRNSAVSICQTFARIGAIVAPNIQLLGDLYWYPIPFIVYGTFSTLSAFAYIVTMQETKDKKLPDTIEEFIE